MILPHVPALFVSGKIILSNEHSEYKWVKIAELNSFEPIIENIAELAEWAAKKLSSAADSQLIEI
jgi:hypothetical protein